MLPELHNRSQNSVESDGGTMKSLEIVLHSFTFLWGRLGPLIRPLLPLPRCPRRRLGWR
jgi:hypothetical protein